MELEGHREFYYSLEHYTVHRVFLFQHNKDTLIQLQYHPSELSLESLFHEHWQVLLVALNIES